MKIPIEHMVVILRKNIQSEKSIKQIIQRLVELEFPNDTGAEQKRLYSKLQECSYFSEPEE